MYLSVLPDKNACGEHVQFLRRLGQWVTLRGLNFNRRAEGTQIGSALVTQKNIYEQSAQGIQFFTSAVSQLLLEAGPLP